MKVFWIAAAIICLCVLNAVWFIQLERLNSKLTYHATHICELERLSSLRTLLPTGTAVEKLEQLCNSTDYHCDTSGQRVLLDLNMTGCPLSGRPYCGYEVIVSENNEITSIMPGYPCH